MRDVFYSITSLLAFLLFVFILQLFFEPEKAAKEANSAIDTVAKIYHHAAEAFDKK